MESLTLSRGAPNYGCLPECVDPGSRVSLSRGAPNSGCLPECVDPGSRVSLLMGLSSAGQGREMALSQGQQEGGEPQWYLQCVLW